MKDSKVIISLLGLLAVFVIGVVLHLLSSVLIPLVVAAFLSYLFKPLLLFLQKRKVPTSLALLFVFIVIGAVMFGFSTVVYSSAVSFIEEAPTYQARINDLVGGITSTIEGFGREYNLPVADFDWTSVINVSALTGMLGSGLGSTVSFAGTVILVLLYLAFILGATGDFGEKVRHSFRKVHSEKISTVVARVDQQVRQYLLAKTLISLGTGLLTTVILLIFGVDFALFWGFLAFVLNYIPNFGSLIAEIFPVLMAFLQFDSIVTPLLLLVILVAMQMVIGNVIEPKVMAFSLDLSPLVVLVALIFWGWLWGIVGAIIAVPLTAILKIIFENVDELEPIANLMGGPVTKEE